MIPHPRCQQGRRVNLRSLGRRGGDQEAKHIAAAHPGLAQVEAFEVTIAAVLLEDQILVARGRATQAGRIQRTEADPGLNGQVGGAQRLSVGDLHILVGAVEAEALGDDAGGAGRRTALQHAVVGPSRIIRVPVPGPPAHQTGRRRHAASWHEDRQRGNQAGD